MLHVDTQSMDCTSEKNVMNVHFVSSCLSLYLCLVTGTAIRHCNEEKGWLVPELFNCTTVTFAHLKKMVRLKKKSVYATGK